MSAYPPPPPAGPGRPPNPQPGYPPPVSQPPYDPRAWKAQAKLQNRMLRAQMKAQREALRAQARAARRFSVVGPLLLVLAGVVALLLETGRLSPSHALDWYGHWWPLLLIGTGVLMLAEWILNGRRGTLLGGGIVFLLVLLGVAGWVVGAVRAHGSWGWVSNGDTDSWSPFLGAMHEEDGPPADAAIAADGALLIRNPHGDVTVTGASEDGRVHVTVHKEFRAIDDAASGNARSTLQPSFSGSPAALELAVGRVDGSHADLEVTVPRGVAVTIDDNSGAVSVAEMHAPVTVTAGRGEVSLSGITGAVIAHMQDSNGDLSVHSVSGSVTVDGRGEDLNLSDLTGPVSIQGEFFGSTHVEHVTGKLGFDTYRTQFSAARVDGQLDISSGKSDAPLEGEALLGPVVLHTKDRVITLDRVQGNVEIRNSNGSVSLNTAGPLGTVSVENKDGSVDVGLPPGAGFAVNAQTQDGHISNDFGLETAGNEDHPSLSGLVGHGGLAVTLTTSDGDITLRKSSAEPLPATAPAPPTLVDQNSPPAQQPDAAHAGKKHR